MAESGLTQVNFVHSQVIYWFEYLQPEQKVSAAIRQAARQYSQATGLDSQLYALMNVIPEGAEEFQDVYGVTLIRAGWVPPNCVVVGHAGMQTIKPEYRHWSRVKA